MSEHAETPETPESPATPSAPRPSLGVGTVVDHPSFGRGKVLGYEADCYVVVFKAGEVKRVAFSFDAMTAEELHGDPELDRVRQAVAEVLGEHGWIDAELELARRWQGGTLRIVSGKDDIQPKEIPLEQFFKKIIGVREKLRVLEQKINNHAALSSEDKLELEGYITRCYGSLTTFNVLFAGKEGQFRGQSGKE